MSRDKSVGGPLHEQEVARKTSQMSSHGTFGARANQNRSCVWLKLMSADVTCSGAGGQHFDALLDRLLQRLVGHIQALDTAWLLDDLDVGRNTGRLRLAAHVTIAKPSLVHVGGKEADPQRPTGKQFGIEKGAQILHGRRGADGDGALCGLYRILGQMARAMRVLPRPFELKSSNLAGKSRDYCKHFPRTLIIVISTASSAKDLAIVLLQAATRVRSRTNIEAARLAS